MIPGEAHGHAYSSHPGLLRARRERPRGRAAEQRNELAALHSITSSVGAGEQLPKRTLSEFAVVP